MKKIFTALMFCAVMMGVQAQNLWFTYDNKVVPEGETIVLTTLDPAWEPDLFVHGDAYLNTDAACEATFTLTTIEGQNLECCLNQCFPPVPVRTITTTLTPDNPALLEFHLTVFDPEEGQTYFGKAKAEGTAGDSSTSMIVYVTNDQNAGVERVTVESGLQCDGTTLSWAGFAGEQTLRVFDMNGRMVYEAQVDGTNGSVTPAVAPGNYIATLGSAKLKLHIK